MEKENKKSIFDTEKELNCMSIDRLFVLQKRLIKDIEYYLLRIDLYTKQDVFDVIQELLIINGVIKHKIEKNKKILK